MYTCEICGNKHQVYCDDCYIPVYNAAGVITSMLYRTSNKEYVDYTLTDFEDMPF